MNSIKEGIVEMKLLFDEFYIDEISNCQLISIYFGVLYHKNKCDMKKTISFVKNAPQKRHSLGFATIKGSV